MRRLGTLAAVLLVAAQGSVALLHASAAGATGRATVVARDQFERAVAGSWGAVPAGKPWIYQPTAGSRFSLSVDGHAARASCPQTATLCKGIFTTGPARPGQTVVQASFSVDHEPAAGTDSNHWHVILRHVGIRSYYSVAYYPDPVNQIRIFVGDGTNVLDKARCDLGLGSSAQTFTIKGRVTDVAGGVRIDGKA